MLHERLLTTQVRNFLGRFLNQTDHGRRSGLTLVACPVADQELAALMATATIRHAKGNATYLGVPVQPEEIAYASMQRNAHHVVVCLAPTADDATVTRYARELRRHLPLSTGIWVHGAVAPETVAKLEAERVWVFETFGALAGGVASEGLVAGAAAAADPAAA